ncbi:MAG: hypothetical protein A4S09_09610 [Proteobacteria bacterium SG_bin7]|nr:MAG: hypothetical protein A4S09_09610 [Proteobacteria bacterium SG_bin7]
MKLIAILFLFIFLSAHSLNVYAVDEKLKGHWVYKIDQCKSGAKPNDRWSQLAYRSIGLFIYDKEFAATVVFQTSDYSVTCSGGVGGTYVVDGNKFVETIKLVNNGNLNACGIGIQTPVDTQITVPYQIKQSLLFLNKPAGGKTVCDKEGDLIEVYERAQ